MLEPLFGSNPHMWPGVLAPNAGWAQLPAPFGNRTIGAGVAGFSSPQILPTTPTGGTSIGPQGSSAGSVFPTEAYGFSAGPVGFAQPPFVGANYGFGFPVANNPFVGAPFTGLVGHEIATFSIPALLTAVAFRRGQPVGPMNDQELEDFIYDALELLPGTNEVEVRCEASRVTFTGSVQHRRLKRDVGEIGWAIPGVNDVQNNLTIATRRRSRGAAREAEAHAGPTGRKQA